MGPARCGIVVFQQRGSNTALAQIATPPELRCTALRGMEFAKSRLDGTVTEHELTNTATVVIAIITVCDTLSVVASLEFGIMAVSYSMFVFGNVVMMVALALDEPEPWYILYVILLSSCYHWNHLIENAFTHKLSPKWPCEIGGRTTARVPTLPGWTGGLCSTRLGWSIALVPFRRDFHGVHSCWNDNMCFVSKYPADDSSEYCFDPMGQHSTTGNDSVSQRSDSSFPTWQSLSKP